VRRVEEPITQERAYETNEGIADNPVSAASQEKSSEPSGHGTDHKDHHGRFSFHVFISLAIAGTLQSFRASNATTQTYAGIRQRWRCPDCFLVKVSRVNFCVRGRWDCVFAEPVLAITFALPKSIVHKKDQEANRVKLGE
jgi:hypothetical protein